MLFQVFAFIKGSLDQKKRIVFDARLIEVDCSHLYLGEDWKEFYPDAKEEIPSNRPAPWGLPVLINCFVDANHAGNLVTRRSHSSVLIYVR